MNTSWREQHFYLRWVRLKLFFKEGLGLFFKEFYFKVIWKHKFTGAEEAWTGQSHHNNQDGTPRKPLWNSGTDYFLDINDKVNSGISDSASISLTSNPGQLIEENRSLFLIVKEMQVNLETIKSRKAKQTTISQPKQLVIITQQLL